MWESNKVSYLVKNIHTGITKKAVFFGLFCGQFVTLLTLTFPSFTAAAQTLQSLAIS
jgi:hypothetical protein